MKKVLIALAFIFVTNFVFPSPTFAQCAITGCNPIRCVAACQPCPNYGASCGGNTGVDIGSTYGSRFGVYLGVGDLVSLIVSNAMVIAGVIVVFLFVAGGIMVVAGAGEGNPQSTAKGKAAVTSAMVGFLIVFTSYWIVRIIEQLTGLQILNPVGPF